MKGLKIIRDKKGGTFAFLDALYLAFGVAVTAVVVMLLTKIPENVYKANIDTAELENYILSERIFAKLSYEDKDSGRFHKGMLFEKKNFLEKLADNPFELGDEKVAFKLMLDGQEVYLDRQFYDIAKPLAPIRYKNITYSKLVIIMDDKAVASLTIVIFY